MMLSSDTLGRFLDSLALSSDIVFNVIPIPGRPLDRFALSPQGQPIIFIWTSSALNALPPNISLANLRITYDVDCSLTNLQGQIENDVFAIIECKSKDRRIWEYFLEMITSVLNRLPLSPERYDLEREMRHLVELFRNLKLPPSSEAVGLWAELFLILQSKNPLVLLSAWHSNPYERFDFSDGDYIDVKSFRGEQRKHILSLEQAQPPEGRHLIFASIRCERSSNGLSLIDLLRRVRNCCNENLDLIQKLESIVGATLGSDVEHLEKYCYDDAIAVDSLEFYDWHSIPSLPLPLPPGISHVKYTVDFSMVEPLAFHRSAPLFMALPNIHAS
jgi:hypothetical protein